MRRVRTPPRPAPRASDAHKASVGRVLVVGGSRDMCGAPALAALGALRAGAGLVRIAVPRAVQPVVAAIRPEATTAGLPQTKDASLGRGAWAAVKAMLPAWDALVLGPGGGRAPDTLAAMKKIAVKCPRPLVLDADGLFALGTSPALLASRDAATVITPHEGEAGRLLDCPSKEVRADREAAALALARATGGVVVLKGPGTLVTDGSRLYRCEHGGPWLAQGGTGDVLSGIAGAFLAGLPATGRDPFGAACLAVHVHAKAADTLARRRKVDRGILASEVAHAVPDALMSHLRAKPSTEGGPRA